MASKRAAEPPNDWEDKFYRLKESFDQLKIEYNEKDRHNKILQAKIRKLENDLSQMNLQLGIPKASTGTRDETELAEVLGQQVAKLKSQNAVLSQKLTQALDQLEKKKREVTLLKRTDYLKRPLAKSSQQMEVTIEPSASRAFLPSGPVITSMPTPIPATVDAQMPSQPNLLDVAKKYKERIVFLEDKLEKIQEENARLRQNSPVKTQVITKQNPELERELRDAQWNLQRLQTQYDHLVSKTSAQDESSRHAEDQIENAQLKIRELRRALEELRVEKELSDVKATRVNNLEELVVDLRQQNRSLEDKIARLCEAPFISDAFGQHETRLRYEELVKERENLAVQIEHLQEAVKTQYSALTSLKQQAAHLREEKEQSDKMIEELKLQLNERELGSNALQDQLKLFSGDGIDVESLERALTMVKRRDAGLQRLPFLEDPENERLITIPAMKRKMEEYQLLNLKLTEENERIESMLKIQSNINRDLHKELEALVRSRDKDKHELEKKAEDFEHVALQRLDKIHSLEAQLRQFIYGIAKSVKSKNVAVVSPDKVSAGDNYESEPYDGSDLVAELLGDRDNDLHPDENLLEVWIKEASIKDGVLPPGSSTFVVVDFFDYESQATTLLSGMRPQWDFAATYKITVDDFLLRYFATGILTIELNMASQGDFTLLSRCTLPLAPLLKSKPLFRLNNHPLLSARSGQVIAMISLDMRMALPVSELYQLFLARHPDEKRYIEEFSSKRMLESSATESFLSKLPPSLLSDDDQSRLFNEIDIVVQKASNLPTNKRTGTPSSYVHFQFLGNPDKFTNPVMDSSNPVFNEKFSFPMVTSDQQLRLIMRSKLQLSVINLKSDEEEDSISDGLIGDVIVSLAELFEGKAVIDTFPIKDRIGHIKGEISLAVKWRYPLKRQRELGMRVLTGTEVENLISAFCPEDSKEGIVDYLSFCRFSSPGKEVIDILAKLRSLFKAQDSLFAKIFGDMRSVTKEVFVQEMIRVNPGLLPAHLEVTFDYLNYQQDKNIPIDRIYALLNLDDFSGMSITLQEKLFECTRELEVRGLTVSRIFEQLDQWGANGLISRAEFKRGLKRMGFNLIDEPEPIQEVMADKHIAVMASDVLDDTLDEDHIIGAGAQGLVKNQSGGESSSLKEFMSQQREIFEKQKVELQARSKELLMKESKPSDISPSDASIRATVERPPLYKTSTQVPDVSVINQNATKLQAAFRGHHTRLKLKESTVETIHSNNISSSSFTQSSNILAVEELLLSKLKAFPIDQRPNVAVAFSRVDQKQLGYVNRKQFAHVMTQYPSLGLHGLELRACMDFFDVERDGEKIDYRAFLQYYQCLGFEVLPAVVKLKTMVLSKRSLKLFRSADKKGRGLLPRSDMLRCLTQLGYGQWSQNVLLSILRLFEPHTDGLVHYSNFFEFIAENEYCREAERLAQKLRELFTQNLPADAQRIRPWFAKIDASSQGVFNLKQFSDFCEKNKLAFSKEAIFGSYSDMDPDGGGVTFDCFFAWCSSIIQDDDVDGAFSSLTIPELQHKAYIYLISFAQFRDLEALSSLYGVYDWRKSADGLMDKSIFLHVTRRAGFPFTANELRMVGTQFASINEANMVCFRKFLLWATPQQSKENDAVDGLEEAVIHAQEKQPKIRAGALARFLEKCLLNGVDLLSVFGRFDVEKQGKISSTEFCAATADLGLSSLTQQEALGLAERFQATAGDFILYRQIVSSLLTRIDETSRATNTVVSRKEISRDSKLPEHLCERFRALIESLILRGIDYRSEFDRFDELMSGTISMQDFVGVMRSVLESDLSDQELHVISKHFRSVEDPNKINYVKLLDRLHPRNIRKISTAEEMEWTTSDYGEELRKLIRKRCDYGVPGELRRPYRHFSRRKGISVKVSREDFATALKALGFHLSMEQESDVFDLVALQERDYFSYPEFVVFTCDPAHKDLIWKLRRSIGRARISEDRIMTSLREADGNASGVLTAKQFHRALDKCGIDLSKTDILRLMLRFDLDETQRVHISSFANFLRGRASGIGSGRGGYLVGEDNESGLEDANDEHDNGYSALRQEILERLNMGYTKGELFAMFDSDDRGVVDLVSLQAGCKKLNFALPRVRLRGLMKRLNTVNPQGLLDRKGFFRALDLHSVDDKGVEVSRPTTGLRFRDLIEDICEQLKQQKLTHREMMVEFENLGYSINKPINKGDLQRVLKKLGILITTNNIDLLFSRFDADKSGELDYREFLDLLGAKSSSSGASRDRDREISSRLRTDTDAILDRIRRSLDDYLGPGASSGKRVKDVFAEIDRNGNSRISPRELREALRVLKVDVRSDDIDLLFSRFDADKSGELDYREFLDLLGAKSSSSGASRVR